MADCQLLKHCGTRGKYRANVRTNQDQRIGNEKTPIEQGGRSVADVFAKTSFLENEAKIGQGQLVENFEKFPT